MSQLADHCSTIKQMLRKYPDCAEMVVDVFHDTVSNQEWDAEDLIFMLEAGLGISEDGDVALNKMISFEKQFLN